MKHYNVTIRETLEVKMKVAEQFDVELF